MPPGSSSGFEDWLIQVWAARNAGRVGEAEALYAAAWGRWDLPADLPPGELYGVLRSHGIASGAVVEFLLLEVSFLRRQLRLTEAAARLDAVEQLARQYGVRRSFVLSFQAGLNALAASEPQKALTAFGQAKLYARTRSERMYADFNFLLCLEDLGLSFGEALDALVRELALDMEEPWAAPVCDQLYAMRARAAYRCGELVALAEFAAGKVGGDQACYYLAWVAELPVFAPVPHWPHGRDEALLHLASRGLEAYLSQYELMTLRGVLCPEDLSTEVKASEHLERLYLWTWRWLVAPKPAQLVTLTQLISFLLSTLTGRLSQDEWLHAACALRWLALFLDMQADTTSRLLGELGGVGPEAATVLDYESNLLDYLFARRDRRAEQASDIYGRLMRHPLAQQSDFLLPALARALAGEASPPPTLAGLYRSLVALCSSSPRPESGILVDVRRVTAQVFNRGVPKTEVTNASLVRLLLLAESGSVSASIVMQMCFDFSGFDQARHEGKLAKLLWSANREFGPFVRWQRRDQSVVATQLDGALTIVGGNAHNLQLLKDSRVADAMICPPPRRQLAPESTAFADAMLTGEFSRKELEERLGLSKTATLQKLEDWEATGRVERLGKGKSTRYRLKSS